MQIKADLTKEQLMTHSDVLSEACHPLEKLKAVADLLYAYPDGPSDMGKATIQSVSDMIQDATEEIECLIKVSNEQWRQDRNKLNVI